MGLLAEEVRTKIILHLTVIACIIVSRLQLTRSDATQCTTLLKGTLSDTAGREMCMQNSQSALLVRSSNPLPGLPRAGRYQGVMQEVTYINYNEQRVDATYYP